jgi:hypothetical protein
MDEFTNKVSKNSIYRSLIGMALFIVIGMFESKMFPWGLGGNSLVPLAVTYFLLGGAVGTQHPEDTAHAAAQGSLVGAFVYIILFVWLFGVGFFSGSLGAGMAKLIFGVASVVIVSVSVMEISKLLKITEDNP